MEDAHLTAEKLLDMVQLKPGSLGPYALISGTKERMEATKKFLTDPIKDFSFFDYEMYTGTYQGKKVSIANGGRYCPDSALITEVACVGGSDWLVRTGTCGGIPEDVKVGDLVIATGVIRGDGTTPYYVPQGFSSVADVWVNWALIKAAERFGVRFHVGLISTTDAILKETKEYIEEMKRLRAKAVDMVSSAFLTVAHLRGKRAGVILVVTDNLSTGELGFMNPDYYLAEENMIRIALEALKGLF